MKINGVVAGATFVLGVILTSLNSAQAQDRCENLFRNVSPFAADKLQNLQPVRLTKKQAAPINQLIKLETSVDSTTGNRSESKYTITVDALGQITWQFKGRIEAALPGYKLVVRDPLREGYKNVTWTGYSNRYVAKAENGKDIIVKIRLRKYGHVANGLEITKDNFEVLSSLKTKSWLEFKIENPESEDAVVKPRVLINDADANLLLSALLTQEHFQEIKNRTKELNGNADPAIHSKNMETVDLMIQSILEIHKKGTRLEPESETLYERDSYKVPLKNKKTGQNFEVQMTVDRNVSVTDVATGYKAEIYKNAPVSVSVVEFKYQESLRQLIAQGLIDDVPGLAEVLRFNEDVEGYSIRRNENNKGKLGHLRRDIEREIERNKTEIKK